MANEKAAAYEQWIEAYVAAQPGRFVRGKCDKATQEMVKAFPELRRAAGFVFSTFGREQHWWCVDPNKNVVDPTREQFQVVFEYEELDLNDPETRKRVPTGVCMNCGEDTYEGKTFCSDDCENITLADFNSGRY